MIVVDTNLLLYAVIDGLPQHARARAWWEGALNGATMVALTDPVVFAFLRLSTNARLFDPPLAVAQATSFVREWLRRPYVDLLTPGQRHLEIALELLEAAGTGGNLTTDVQIAAYAIERDAAVFSNDADFGRFPGLRWTNPLAADN